MIPANVSIGALLDENKRLRAELARRDRQLALRADWLLALRAEVERLRGELARRDEQIAAVRALVDGWARATEQDTWASVYMDDAAEAITEALDGAS